MKKLLLLFLSFFTLPVFASGIATNSTTAPCTNNTLETYSGNSNLQADWQPNTINLRWYNGNTLMDVQESANTCVYDSALTIPSTAPNRTGYTFAGWQVRPEIDFSTIPTNVNGGNRWAIGWYNNANYCWNGVYVRECDENAFNDLQIYEWRVPFSHGTLYGMSGCSTTRATEELQTGNPNIENGTEQYCWCKATGYLAANDNIIRGSLYVLPWVVSLNVGRVNDCARDCATECSEGAKNVEAFRTALFTPAN